jgi:UDP-N-acetylmuramyl pentapeptide phosphotransferase/UDP-N-acetylglucosamine-1-phosphate transferase
MSFALTQLLVFASTVFALLFVDTERAALARRAAKHLKARQASHTVPTPRIGGLAIAVGVLSGALLSESAVFSMLLWTTLPLFLVGLVEDLGPHTSPRLRLSLAALSSVLAIIVLDIHIDRAGIPLLDPVFAVAAVGIAVTVLVSSGFTHAMNLVDGLNGLSGAIVIMIVTAFAVLSYEFGHADLVALNVTILSSFLAFMVWNFPSGKIFLGDAGAYSAGHIIAWNGIILMYREPDISPWAILLIVIWPVLETLFSMFRRAAQRQSMARPDRMHFHHVVMRLTRIADPSIGVAISNPLASSLIWPLAAIPCALGVAFARDLPTSAALVAAFAVCYVLAYVILVKVSARLRRIAQGVHS